MKVQLQDQSLRLRIGEAELARLLAGETVENLTRFPAGLVSRQQVRLIEAALPSLLAEPGGWCFGLPREQLLGYVQRLPCRDGLMFQLPLADRDAIEIHFEVDVRDSMRSRGAVPRSARHRSSTTQPD